MRDASRPTPRERTRSSESPVARHYERLLARHYAWMVGASYADKVAEQRALLQSIGVSAVADGQAVDLGCGPGYQSAALLELGFRRVLAIDSSAELLSELRGHIMTPSVEPLRDDIGRFHEHVDPGSTRVITCMGDTLTHLPSWDDVRALVRDARSALARDGRLVLTYRDLSRTVPDAERFVLVRGDAERVMVCVLEYDTDAVFVNDVMLTREDGVWSLQVGRYPKLRIDPADLRRELEATGFRVDVDRAAGRLHATVATRIR